MPLAGRHHEVESVVRIAPHAGGAACGLGAQTAPRQFRSPTLGQIRREAQGHPPPGPADGGKGHVHVAAQIDAVVSAAALQPGPEPLQAGPENLEILVRQRALEQPETIAERSGAGKAIAPVARLGSDLLVAGQQEEDRAEDVDRQTHGAVRQSGRVVPAIRLSEQDRDLAPGVRARRLRPARLPPAPRAAMPARATPPRPAGRTRRADEGARSAGSPASVIRTSPRAAFWLT